MISFLKGILADKKPPMLVIDVQGVGYELTASMNTFYSLPDVGKPIFMYTQLIVREDAHLLYGFKNEQERQLFQTLIKVNGVGPKLAITILSSIDPDSFVQCIQSNDTTNLTRIPGIGKKTAERLVVDLRDRLQDWHTANLANLQQSGTLPAASAKQDAISALITLGYKPQEAKRAVDSIANDELSSEEFIRQSLKYLVK